MALSVTLSTINAQHGWSPTDAIPIVHMSMPGDAAYPAGGSAGVKAFVEQMLVRGIERVIAVHGHAVSGGAVYALSYDAVNDKLLVLDVTNGAEATPGDLSAITFTATFFLR